MVLYAMSSIAKVSIADLTRELWPFMISIVAILILITYVPAMVTFLPSLFFR
jgi:TRAP-type C4-dicarboxylate transport system permease large subunit